jgi:hypothetical protein
MAGKGRKADDRRADRRFHAEGGELPSHAAGSFPLMHGEPAKRGDPPIESRADAPRSRHGGSSAPGSVARTHAPGSDGDRER